MMLGAATAMLSVPVADDCSGLSDGSGGWGAAGCAGGAGGPAGGCWAKAAAGHKTATANQAISDRYFSFARPIFPSLTCCLPGFSFSPYRRQCRENAGRTERSARKDNGKKPEDSGQPGISGRGGGVS